MSYKRGIPGVRSDAHPFGYFEDSTSNRSIPPVHSDFEPLSEALYIFAGLIICYTLLTFICFSLREYIYSFKNRQDLYNDSVWSNNSVFTIQNEAEIPLEEIKQDDVENFPQVLFTSLDVVQMSPNKNYSTDSESFLPLKSAKSKIIYSIKQLQAMKPAEYDDLPLTIINEDEADPSIQLDFSSKFKYIEFISSRNIEKTILEIRKSTISKNYDKATKLIQIYRLVVIIGNSISENNPNIYLKQVNKFMDELIDTGLIFELINESNAYLSRSLIQVVLQYCYSHWFFNDSNTISIKYLNWSKSLKPEIQNHTIIFRFLINLQLGLSILEKDVDTYNLFQFKIKFLSNILIENLNCNDIIDLIDLLFEAIDVSITVNTKKIFLENFYLLIINHSHCCNEKLFHNSLLKKIITLIKNSNNEEFKKIYDEIYSIALIKNQKIDSLWDDAPIIKDKSNKFVQKELERPGSWKNK